MAAVLGSMDSHLFELRNFKANEFSYRERNSNKMKPARGSSQERSRASPSSSPISRKGTSGETQVIVSPSRRRIRHPTTQTAIVESLQVKRTISTSDVAAGGSPTPSNPAGSVESRRTDNNNRDLALRSPFGGGEETITSPEFCSNDLAAGARRESKTDPTFESKTNVFPSLDEATLKKLRTDNNNRDLALRSPLGGGEETITSPEFYSNDLAAGARRESKTYPTFESKSNVFPSLDEATLKKLVKMVVREIHGEEKTKVPICLDDFTGEKSPYLAENAVVWLKKLRLAARQNEWNHALALEVASVHLKGLAARWFASIEKHLNEELHLDRDRWNYFESQFEERFADFRSRLLQVEKIKDLKLGHGQDVREYAEAIMSMNFRLEEPLDDEFLRWVFIQGLPASELRDKLFKFEEKPHTLASAVKYARRFQLSQSVFNLKDHSTPIPRMIPPSTPARSVRSN